jgi:hypothetical protein
MSKCSTGNDTCLTSCYTDWEGGSELNGARHVRDVGDVVAARGDGFVHEVAVGFDFVGADLVEFGL